MERWQKGIQRECGWKNVSRVWSEVREGLVRWKYLNTPKPQLAEEILNKWKWAINETSKTRRFANLNGDQSILSNKLNQEQDKEKSRMKGN